ncbi:MAG: hypothetical protein H6708_17240 [Kofleriaceae bacterium]|nr:hypothetical protein [Myxococcales bacterium]MCB9562152.1 hypothetical protein [Kofleriaceae bacterium]
MRLVGILALAVGAAGAAYAIHAALTARRPTDLAWALVAPLAIGLAVIGVVTTVFPGFLGT